MCSLAEMPASNAREHIAGDQGNVGELRLRQPRWESKKMIKKGVLFLVVCFQVGAKSFDKLVVEWNLGTSKLNVF